MSETIGFIGLGNLGLRMATNLVDAGWMLRVHNRTASKADPLVSRGAVFADRPADAATPGGVVVSALWDDASVESLVEAAGFLERLGSGGVHVSMSTVSPEAARRIAALHAQRGVGYVEAPVFGRPEAATARQLLVSLAGKQAEKERVRPVLEALGAERIFDFGEAPGAAVTVKLIGNFMIISAAQTMTEGLSLAEKCGVDPRAVIEMLTTTLFAAPIYQSYGKMIVEGRRGLQSPIPLKDMGLFLKTANEVGALAPIASRVHANLEAQAQR